MGSAVHTVEVDFITEMVRDLRGIRKARVESVQRGSPSGPVVKCGKLKPSRTASAGNGSASAAAATNRVLRKKVHFVRHGEGHHNARAQVWFDSKKPGNPFQHPSCPIDPELTDLGVDQAKQVREKCQSLGLKPQLIVVSPLRRTLATATFGFEHLIPSVPFVAHEDCREILGQNRCDRRFAAPYHQTDYPHVDFSLLHDGAVSVNHTGKAPSVPPKQSISNGADDDLVFNAFGMTREPHTSAVERALNFLTWLRDRPEDDIVVVTHSAWLCVAFNGAMSCDEEDEDMQEWFHTGEMRSTVLEFFSNAHQN